jgi:putative addiction module component (TIGR02574 family)
MPISVQELGLDQMSIEDRLVVAEAIWDSVTSEIASSQIPDSQLEELQRRLSDSIARPEAVVPWEHVKAKALARART